MLAISESGTAIILPGPPRLGSDPKWDRRSAFELICRLVVEVAHRRHTDQVSSDFIGAWPIGPHRSPVRSPGRLELITLEHEETAVTSSNHLPAARVVVGVDTHRDEHVGVAIDQLGVRLGEHRLDIIQGRSVLCSIHSAGCPEVVLHLLKEKRPMGGILHWFNNDRTKIDRAVDLGCAFSVNTAMPDNQIGQLPRDRALPETDFPALRFKTAIIFPGPPRLGPDPF